MASRTFQPALALDRGTVTLYGSFLSGGASITSQDCLGFTVSQTGTGAYTVTLDEGYPTSPANYVSSGTVTSPLLDVNFVQQDSGNTQALFMVMTADSVATSKTFTLVFNSAANTPANPASGTRVRLSIALKNSSTPRKGS